MIICSCNVLSDHDVRSAVQRASPRTTFEVYGCLGCSAQCGRCARSIRQIMDEVKRGSAAPALKIAEGSAPPQPTRKLRSVA